jgi:hypothetical protein
LVLLKGCFIGWFQPSVESYRGMLYLADIFANFSKSSKCITGCIHLNKLLN